MTQRSSDPDKLSAEARAIVDDNAYMTLGTADEHGVPWATPVWFAHEGYREFIWVSRPRARHSQNIAARAEVGIVIFDSRVAPGSGQAVYMSASAAQVADADRGRAIEIFARRSAEQGAGKFTLADVEGDAELRLYHALASEHFVLGEVDERVPVSL
jgi:hypothetical protein